MPRDRSCCTAGAWGLGASVVGSEEGLEWSWFDADDLPEDLLPYATVWLGDALAPSGEVLVR